MLLTILIAFAVAADTKCKSDLCTGEPATDTSACCDKLEQLGDEDGQKKYKEIFSEADCGEDFSYAKLFGCQSESDPCVKHKRGDEVSEECKPTKNAEKYKDVCKVLNKYLCDAGYTKVELTVEGVTVVGEFNCPASPDPPTPTPPASAIPAKSAISVLIVFAMSLVALL